MASCFGGWPFFRVYSTIRQTVIDFLNHRHPQPQAKKGKIMLENILIVVSLVCIIGLGFAIKYLWRFWKENTSLNRKYGKIMDVEAERDRIDSENKKMSWTIQNKKASWERDFSAATKELTEILGQLDSARDQQKMESFGIYESHYDFESSAGYKGRLDEIRRMQKVMVRDDTAASCSMEWTVDGSRAKGRHQEKRFIKLLIRAFNGECDAGALKVKYNNIVAMETRISRSFEALNKLGESQHISISPRYLDLKISELRLVHEFQEKKEAEKEEQRRIRELMREEERVRREAEKAQADAEREEKQYESALERARRELQRAGEDQRQELEDEIAKLQQQLEEAHQNKERAVSRAQQTRSGYVYIISNVGSFGEDVYKIGLTRRLDPDDRIKELGDASVPFPFDVHAMIYSEDAPSLENLLHQAFDNRRVNLVNLRKEFFRVSLDEIKNATEGHGPIEFTLAAEAEQFRRTLAILEKSDQPAVNPVAENAEKVLEERLASWRSDGHD